jgi:hypothetical protein
VDLRTARSRACLQGQPCRHSEEEKAVNGRASPLVGLPSLDLISEPRRWTRTRRRRTASPA